MQEADKLGQIADGDILPLGRQSVLKRYVDAAVAVLNVKDHGIAASLFPALYQADSMSAAGGHAGQVDGAHLAIFRKGTALFHDRLGFHAWNQNLFVFLE